MLIKKTVSVDIRLDDQDLRTLRHICELARVSFLSTLPIDNDIAVRLDNLTEEEKENILPFMKEIYNI